MSFVSYAQNFEDVMLWRALRHIRNGFYVDIGAQDPVVDSVSMAFYEQGWRGLHVEPTAQYSSLLRKARHDELVEQSAIGQEAGELDFYEFTGTGLSTADVMIAQQHIQAGYAYKQTRVPVLTLDTLLDKYAGTKTVHWLKLDVEGHEKSALSGWKSSQVRPWILVIESTKPMSQAPSHQEWEPLALEKGYLFAYFDGLNRFYVHQSQRELLAAFEAPPNVFDGFVLSGTATHPFALHAVQSANQAQERARQAEAKERDTHQLLQDALTAINRLQEQAQHAEARAARLDERVLAADTRVAQLEQRVISAEADASQQAQRALSAENLALQREQRALSAEAHTARQEQRALSAEARAAQLEQRALAAEAHAAQLAQRAQAAEAHGALQEQHARWSETQIASLLSSRSWRVTHPVRYCFLQLRRLRDQGLAARIKALTKKTLRRVAAFVDSRPDLRNRAMNWAHRLGFYQRLRSFYRRVKWQADSRPTSQVALDACATDMLTNPNLPSAMQLTPRARQIYRQLTGTMANSSKA